MMASSVSFSPSISAATRSPMMSLVRLLPPLLDLVEEVTLQLRRCGQPGHDVGLDGDQVEGQPPEHVEIFRGESEQHGDDPGRKLERQRLHQVGVAVVFDLVDQLIADRPDDRWLPAFQRGSPKSLGHQAAVVVVFFAAHRQDGVAHHQTDRLVVGGRSEDPVVAEAPGTRRHSRTRPTRLRAAAPRASVRWSMKVPCQTGSVRLMYSKYG